MKTLSPYLAVVTVLTFSFASILRAQDGPPPPDSQYAPPPPQDAQGAPPDMGGTPPPDQGGGDDQGASFQEFYDQLGSQGTWVQTDNYGYVFQPNVTDPNWAPYTNGHWVYSEAGWVWVSDEPWGWATYHYGRWANIDGCGWVWVPGYRWAPAWVSWRYGGGYCGWAPLPPETFIGAEYGGGGGWASFHFGGDVDVSFGIGAGCYNFVRVGDFGSPNYYGHYIDRSRNYTVINNTTNITNINISRGNGTGTNFRNVTVGGPQINEINAHSRERVQTVQLTQANQPGRSTLNGNSLAVYAPRMNAASLHQARPAQVGQTIAHPTFNRGNSISQPLQVTRDVKAPAPSEQAIQEAQTAQLHAPKKARIATENTQIKTPISQPLTQMTPVSQMNHTANTATHPATASGFNNATTHPGEVHSANSPYTGQSVNPGSTYHPQSINPEVQHSTANSPYTGEPANNQAQQEAHQRQVEAQQQTQQAQQERQQQAAEQQLRAQQEARQQEAVHQQQVQPQAQTEEHHYQSQPQPQSSGAQSFHPQGGGAPAVHEQSAPAHTQAAPAPASHPAPSGGGGGGGGNKPSGNGNNQQNH
jgi:hypothetical protein